MIPALGDSVPPLELIGDDGEPVQLRPDRNHVLFFFPKARTSGCTKEVIDFKDHFDQIQALGTEIIGISRDPVEKLKSFRTEQDLPFPLASSVQASEVLGVWQQKSMYGRTYMGIQRTTFILGGDRTILAVWPKVAVKGHAAAVIKALEGLHVTVKT